VRTLRKPFTSAAPQRPRANALPLCLVRTRMSNQNRLLRTALFVAVVGGVLATFVVLGQQGTPPNMPASSPHKLRFNLKGDLIGVEGEAGLDEALKPGFVLEKKVVEGRVNTTCQTCHAAPGAVAADHPCHALNKCVPEHHPPKTECIKCHRMPKQP
jgi:hypothetical protein